MQILTTNLPRLLELQLCSTFNPDLQWTEQVERCFISYFVYFFKLATGVIIIFLFKLSPLLGQEETDKLDNKLRSLNVTGNESPPSMMITITSTARCKTVLVKLITHLFLLQTLTTSTWATCSSSPAINTRTKPGLRFTSMWMTPLKQSQSILLSCQQGISNVNYITFSLAGCWASYQR